MKFGVVNKSTILNRFVLHTLRKTNIKLGILKGGNWKRAEAGKEPVQFSVTKKVNLNRALFNLSAFFHHRHNSMNIGMVNKLTIMNRTTMKIEILTCGGGE